MTPSHWDRYRHELKVLDLERTCSWCGESLYHNGITVDRFVCIKCIRSDVAPTDEAQSQYVHDYDVLNDYIAKYLGGIYEW